MPRDMPEQEKVVTQTVSPADSTAATRKPSAKEREWEKKTLQPTLEKRPERLPEFTTVCRRSIRRPYTEAHLAGWAKDRELGYPGEPPYTRGIHATMYPRRRWTVR